jgi:hypothetical protein
MRRPEDSTTRAYNDMAVEPDSQRLSEHARYFRLNQGSAYEGSSVTLEDVESGGSS